MRQLTINPNNRQYYSEDFIKGFNCGAHRQFEADKSDADRPQGEWINHFDDLFPEDSTIECSVCHEHQPMGIDENYCPNCGARMFAKDTNVPNKKGADDD